MFSTVQSSPLAHIPYQIAYRAAGMLVTGNRKVDHLIMTMAVSLPLLEQARLFHQQFLLSPPNLHKLFTWFILAKLQTFNQNLFNLSQHELSHWICLPHSCAKCGMGSHKIPARPL